MPEEKDSSRIPREPRTRDSRNVQDRDRDRNRDRDRDPRRVTRTQQRRRNSVFRYIAVLFMAAFVLLLVTFLMERRQSQQQIDDLKQSVSAFQTLQGMMTENSELKDQVGQLQDQITALQSQISAAGLEQDQLRGQLQDLEKSTQALDWFWQINEAYVRGRYTTCRSLIQSLEEAGLQDYLPQESITDNDRFSPADRFAEIRGRVIR